MIVFFSSWVKNLSLSLIIVSILEMLLPNNKTKKYVKMIMGIYILFCIVYPFIQNNKNIDIENINFNTYAEVISSTSSDEVVNQESMDKRLEKLYIEELEKDIIRKVNTKGYEVEECKVYAEISENESSTGISKIELKIAGKKDEEQTESENHGEMEEKLVKEIQKIQKVEINVSNNNQEETENIENTNITKTDIEIIKKFLVEEYEVNEKCLKIN